MSIVTNMTNGGNSGISTNNAVVFVTIVSSHELLGTDNIITMTKGNIVLKPSLWRNGDVNVIPSLQVVDKKTAIFFLPPACFDSVNSWTVSHTIKYFTHSETIIVSSNKEYSLDFSSATYTGWIIKNGRFTNEFRQDKFAPQNSYGSFALTASNDSTQWQLNEDLFNYGEIKDSFSDYISEELDWQMLEDCVYLRTPELSQYVRFKAYTPLIGNVVVYLDIDGYYSKYSDLVQYFGVESTTATAPSILSYSEALPLRRHPMTLTLPTNVTTTNISLQIGSGSSGYYAAEFWCYDFYITGNLMVVYELPPDE